MKIKKRIKYKYVRASIRECIKGTRPLYLKIRVPQKENK